MRERQLHLGGFFSTPGNHLAGWRHPAAVPTADMDFRMYAHITQVVERAKFDTIFFQDTAAVNGSEALARGDLTRTRLSRIVKLEPTALLCALAALTTHIGLIATATTTYNEPYNIARRFASIDHISGGRAGWNLVTSQIEDEAQNFGLDAHVRHAQRYARATEFYDVVVGLWDSWDDDALLRDKANGIYMDRDKVHFLDHVGEHFKVRGPLNITRSPQGRPVVAQAGSSEVGTRTGGEDGGCCVHGADEAGRCSGVLCRCESGGRRGMGGLGGRYRDHAWDHAGTWAAPRRRRGNVTKNYRNCCPTIWRCNRCRIFAVAWI